MNTVTALEAKTRLGELLDRVARGEEVVITRHEKPIARLIPEEKVSLESTRETIRGFRILSEKIAKRRRGRSITDVEIRDAIEQGRR